MPQIYVDNAEKIANSQAAWAILFIILFFIIVTYLIRASDRREKKLMDFHEQSKADSRERENRLMNHLEKNTEEMSKISNAVSDVQRELVRMNDRMDEIQKGVH